jgi:predicted nucleic acid-binding protein
MIAVDSSVVIPLLCIWHEFHERAAIALQTRKKLLLPLPVLNESYSVLTRLPSPYRVQGSAAYQSLHGSFSDASIATLPADKAWSFLDEVQVAGITGGRIYDALIAAIAIEAGAQELITFNPRHFEPFSDRLRITIP